MKVTIDTNVVLSAITDRDARQRAQAETLFRAAAAGQMQILLPQCCLFEVLYVLDSHYGTDPRDIAEITTDLTAMPSLRVIHEVDLERWRSIWPGEISDPADAAVLCVALTETTEIATFDRRVVRNAARLGVQSWNWTRGGERR